MKWFLESFFEDVLLSRVVFLLFFCPLISIFVSFRDASLVSGLINFVVTLIEYEITAGLLFKAILMFIEKLRFATENQWFPETKTAQKICAVFYLLISCLSPWLSYIVLITIGTPRNDGCFPRSAFIRVAFRSTLIRGSSRDFGHKQIKGGLRFKAAGFDGDVRFHQFFIDIFQRRKTEIF